VTDPQQQLTPGDQAMAPVVRAYIAQKLYTLVDALEPYVDGTMGPVSSKHVANYVAGLKLLGQLYRSFDRDQVVTGEVAELPAARVLQDKVLHQLEQIQSRGGQG